MNDRAKEEPGKFHELKAEWDAYAKAVGYIEASEVKQLEDMSPEEFFQYTAIE